MADFTTQRRRPPAMSATDILTLALYTALTAGTALIAIYRMTEGRVTAAIVWAVLSAAWCYAAHRVATKVDEQ